MKGFYFLIIEKIFWTNSNSLKMVMKFLINYLKIFICFFKKVYS